MIPVDNFKSQKGLQRRTVFYSLRILLVILFISLAFISVFSSTVLATPIINYSALPNGQLSTPYFATLTAVSLNPITWSSPGGLPPGLTLNASGIISGTPTMVGTFSFTVQADDGVAPPASAIFSITIAPPPFLITTSTLSDGEENLSYSASLIATGGTTPYTWSLSGGSLPSGLTLNSSTGYISGLPKIGSEGTTSFTITVTDSSSPQRTAQKTFTIYIEQGTFQPTISIGTGLEAGTTKVKIDGIQVASLSGGEAYTFNLDLGTSKTVTVDEIVQHPSEDNVRFKTDDDAQVVNQTNQDAFFEYHTEYDISILTSPSQITTIGGAGWYKKDDNILINSRPEVEKDNQTMYKFSYWLLPDSTQVSSDPLNYTVETPGIITAYYDTYYKLSVDSMYGSVDGQGWYKSGTQATWSLVNDSVPMQGIIGLFQGKYRASIASGTITMDSAKTVTVPWEPDYTMPYILIPTVIVVIILAVVGFYFLLRRPQAKPAFVGAAGIPPVAPRPIPQQHTTVVMIENKTPQKQLPGTTKDQLIEKFAELLDKYEAEIKTTLAAPQGAQAPQIQQSLENMIAAPVPPVPPPESNVLDGEVINEETMESTCGATSKKLLRTVAGKWRQLESDTVTTPAKGDDKAETTGLSITWGRDLYHEWEISKCTLTAGHKGKHRGDVDIVYSLLNTVSLRQSYTENQPINPPSPHFTESMPELEPERDKIVTADELPLNTI
jgi:hypothetical protein